MKKILSSDQQPAVDIDDTVLGSEMKDETSRRVSSNLEET
jgi:hypothetical protein